MDDNAFKRDLAEILVARARAGAISKREFLFGLSALGGLGVLAGTPAHAQAKEVVLANWGGDAVKFMGDAWGAPFEKDTGIKVAIDSSGPSLAKIKAMVESGKVTWDVLDTGAGTSFDLGKAGLLERIDYSIVDKTQIPPAFAMPWCVGNGAYSYVIAYDTSKVGATPPQNWAEFWDVKRWPGKRTMRKSMHSVLEAALLADGVARDKIYPIDTKRAFDKVKQIKEHIVWWNAGADSQQLIRDGECVIGNIWSTRAKGLETDSRGRITWTWNDGIVTSAVLAVPRGNPAGKAAMQFINSTLIPERQVAFFKTLGTAPANPRAAALVPAELKRFNALDTDNAAKQIFLDDAWYADNYVEVYAKFLDLISS
jgi:putative spermidine/putrescine transport system substrate-binding protein